MKRNTLVKKIVGGVLALAAIAAIGMGSASTASAQPRFVGGGVRVEARFAPAPIVFRDHFRRDRFYYRDRFVHRYDRCDRW